MKKKLVASLAAAMVLSVAGTSFAATNPFTDVPAKHWSYDAVTKLANAGIVDGYGDGTFRGDKTISRYEMAQIVAKAMAHSDQATAEQKASIDKLSVEFAEELEGLNVRVTKLEKNSSTIKVSGEARLRYEDYDRSLDSFDNPTDRSSNSFKLRTRVNLDGQINDEWSYYGRLEANTDLRGDSAARETDDKVRLDNAYVKGQLFGTTATVGRFDYFLGNGLMIDSALNGVNLGFGNVLKANVFYGKERSTTIYDADTHLEVTGAGLDYNPSKATYVHGGYYQYKDTDTSDKMKIWETGFKTKFTRDFYLAGSYGESDADAEDTAYYAELGYKGADKNKVGSYGVWVNYRNLEAAAAPATTTDGAYAYNSQYAGGKGYELGFNYTPMLNTVLRVKYADLKPTNDSLGSDKTKFIQAQAEFFF